MAKARVCEKCYTINLYQVENCKRCNFPLKYIDIDDAVEYSEEDFYPAKPDNYNDAWKTTQPSLKDAGKYYTNTSNSLEKKKITFWDVLWYILIFIVSFFLVCTTAIYTIPAFK